MMYVPITIKRNGGISIHTRGDDQDLHLSNRSLMSYQTINLDSKRTLQHNTSNTYETLTESKPCVPIFIDFAKTFDSVRDPPLLQSLYEVGNRDNVLQLFQTYLYGRRHQVQVGDILEYGVPEGLVQGSLLMG